MQEHWSQTLVPRFILDKLAENELHGNFDAASLFVDISGFTALTETLLERGAAGAEVLADTIQAVFDPLIEQIYAFGGFVTGFAGDAFYALFPGEHFQVCQNAVNAASGIRRHMLANPEQTTPFATFRFEIKLGIAFGEVEWGIVLPDEKGDHERVAAYYFHGSAIEDSTIAENMARPGEIIISTKVLQILRATVTIETIGSPYFFRIRALKFPTKPSRKDAPPPPSTESFPITPEIIAQLIPSAIRNQTVRGEFRQVVSLMINLPESHLAGRLDNTLQKVFVLQAQYGGYLNGVLFGDKGCHILLYWGTPTSYENDLERAMYFSLALQAALPFPIRGGMTYQFMYTGFIGAAIQTNYACYGRGVNLAARCMASAPWGEVWVDEQVARRAPPSCELEWVGHLQFKGFGNELPVFRLSHRQKPKEVFYEGELVGREGELGELAGYLQPIFEGRFSGTTVIEGEVGIGKSRLVHTLQKRLPGCRFFTFQSDQTQNTSFAPIRSFLRQYFQQTSNAPSASTNQTHFMTQLRALIDRGDLQLQSELSLTYSCLGALIGLRWPGSHYEQLDPQGRFQNTLLGLKALLKAESLRQPLVVFVEDAQWLDEDSQLFFEYLTRNIETYPIGMLITTRARGDVLKNSAGPRQTLTLSPLTRPGLVQLAEETLHQPATPALIDFLYDRAEGNPFFAEQILLYLEENDLLIETETGLSLSDEIETEFLPVDVRAILTARLDSLTQEVKTVVQTASVLGREFEILVLAQMLQEDHDLMRKVDQASQAAIWSALNQLQYLFRHALLRDTAYNMQLLSRRRELHTLAAESLEKLQSAGISAHFGELAYHYEQAGFPVKALLYIEKAGDAAAYDYQNARALDYYSRAMTLAPAGDLATRFRLTLAMEKIYDLEGKRDSQKTACQTLQDLAQGLDDPLSQAEAALQFAYYYRAINDYPQTVKAARQCIALVEGRHPNLEASAYVRLGHTLWLQGHYDESKDQLERALELTRAKDFTDHKLVGEIWRNLGVVFWFLRNLEAAENRYRRSLNICRAPESRDMRGEAACINNLGILEQDRGNYHQAKAHYQEAIEVYQKAGDRQGEGNTLANLGGFAASRGDYPLAIETFQRVFSLVLETGDRHGQGHAQNHLGQIATSLGQYNTAKGYYDRALSIYTEINDHRGIGHIYLNSGYLALREEKLETALQQAEAAIAHVQKWRDPPTEGAAWLVAGQAYTCQRQYQKADEALAQAEHIFKENAATNVLMETYTAQAHLLMVQGKHSLALEKIAPVIQHLEPAWANPQDASEHRLFGTKHPFQVYWTCYQVLSSANDPRARMVLETARVLLQKIGNRIQDDALWHSYLENIRVHAEIMNKE
ncbi:MAG TPA: tetratricopeptide repeat protein [Anaerolineales bacterium]|nr:tetratricopeptide repeat protein [Anaerolineales bacterium]